MNNLCTIYERHVAVLPENVDLLSMAKFYEFFAGGGMARAGLGYHWKCLFANDFDPRKAASYVENWGGDELVVADVATLGSKDLPDRADLAWASFPCQDLSLAGAGAGLNGGRSGTFWAFARLLTELGQEHRAPKMVVLENVSGTLSSHGGRDFQAIADTLTAAGYRFGAMIVNAVHFLPQSRPRFFMVAVHQSVEIPSSLLSEKPDSDWHPAALIRAHAGLTQKTCQSWVWWQLPTPPKRMLSLSDTLEKNPQGVKWHFPEETAKLLAMMNPANAEKIERAMQMGRPQIGTIYKRTRIDGADGKRRQRAEVRFDDVAGCLRTPTGGSSRQTLIIVDGKNIRSRLLSPREAARLMGLPDSYRLPNNYNEAYHLAGDGVAVPVVRFLAEHLLEPLLDAIQKKEAA